MSAVYSQDSRNGADNTPPSRVNFGWLGEAWKLFGANAPLWIAAVIIGVYGPVIVDGCVLAVMALAPHAVNALAQHELLHTGGLQVRHMLEQNPRLWVGIGLLNVIFSTFVLTGVCKMAVKQVAGESIAFSDIFSGSATFGSMLLYSILYTIVISVASLALLVPGALLGGMLLPVQAMIADGVPIADAVSRSMREMGRDRWTAAAFAFVLGVMIACSGFVVVGVLVTLPMAALISALARRDILGPASREPESIDTILGINEIDSNRVLLTGDPEDADSTAPPVG
ncbi:MAG: hypothetical protein ACLQVD_09760 [Capsulimonadaceae bacterium]